MRITMPRAKAEKAQERESVSESFAAGAREYVIADKAGRPVRGERISPTEIVIWGRRSSEEPLPRAS
jgi:hypothetical protein